MGGGASRNVALGELMSNAREFLIALSDGVVGPLVEDLCAVVGMAPPPSLPTLPPELQRQCFDFLQVSVRVIARPRLLPPSRSCLHLWPRRMSTVLV